jgi:hypothetical protein
MKWVSGQFDVTLGVNEIQVGYMRKPNDPDDLGMSAANKKKFDKDPVGARIFLHKKRRQRYGPGHILNFMSNIKEISIDDLITDEAKEIAFRDGAVDINKWMEINFEKPILSSETNHGRRDIRGIRINARFELRARKQ